MDDVIKYLLSLKEKTKSESEKKLIERAITACAAFDPKCHHCKWHRSNEWFSECEHPNHFEYDGEFGYFCEDFEPRGECGNV